MARILFTGNRGFLGSRFHRLYDQQHRVLGIDKDNVDILDAAALERCFRDFRPEIVYHAAAITSTDFSNANPELTEQINVDGAVNVARATRNVGGRLVFISTEQVFNGNPEPGPYSEEATPVPNTMYGRTKLEAEGQLREILEELWILRFTWLFGLPERRLPVNPNILWNAVQIALTGRRSRVATREFRGHTYGYDMLEALIRVPEIPYGTYHIGSRNDLDRFELTREILRELGLGDRLGELLQADEEKFRETPRDIRLDAGRIAAEGISFGESREAISRCLREFSLA